MRRGRVAKEARQAAAKERQAERNGRTNEQQLKKLINEGHEQCKEARRLAGKDAVDDFIEGLTFIDKYIKKAEFCPACGASIPHREGEGRCELCLDHEGEVPNE